MRCRLHDDVNHRFDRVSITVTLASIASLQSIEAQQGAPAKAKVLSPSSRVSAGPENTSPLASRNLLGSGVFTINRMRDHGDTAKDSRSWSFESRTRHSQLYCGKRQVEGKDTNGVSLVACTYIRKIEASEKVGRPRRRHPALLGRLCTLLYFMAAIDHGKHPKSQGRILDVHHP